MGMGYVVPFRAEDPGKLLSRASRGPPARGWGDRRRGVRRTPSIRKEIRATSNGGRPITRGWDASVSCPSRDRQWRHSETSLPGLQPRARFTSVAQSTGGSPRVIGNTGARARWGRMRRRKRTHYATTGTCIATCGGFFRVDVIQWRLTWNSNATGNVAGRTKLGGRASPAFWFIFIPFTERSVWYLWL